MAMNQDWNHIRATRFSTSPSPPEWPAGVRPISMNGVSLIGVHPATNRLYWDGQAIVTEQRLANFERVLAMLATGSAVVVAAVELGRAFGWIAFI